MTLDDRRIVPTIRERVLGCFLGGAAGDALGAPIEFKSLLSILDTYGDNGITDFDKAHGLTGEITDDTQMTLFTAEGLIRARLCKNTEGKSNQGRILKNAYYRWLVTQGYSIPEEDERHINNGWLISNEFLHCRRAPGVTVLSALTNFDRSLHYDFAVNNSKGCGGVMRVAPIGLCAADPFALASDAAHYTHGHPTGYLSAGAFAVIIQQILNEYSLLESIGIALEILQEKPGHDETTNAIKQAVQFADEYELSPVNVEKLGSGWVAEEALAISLFCALKAADFRTGVLASVNHSGDSDSTGSICGNILGTLSGIDAIPDEWKANVEGSEVITQLSHDFIDVFITDDENANIDRGRYPPG